MIMSENTMLADRSKKSSRVLFIIVGIGVVGLFLFFVVHSIQKRRSVAEAARLASAPHTIEVRVVSPSLAPDTTIILLPGTVQGHRETSLYARVNGYIRNWYVDIGDPVKEGQLLAELETPELDQQLAQARANLEFGKSKQRNSGRRCVHSTKSGSRWSLSCGARFGESTRGPKILPTRGSALFRNNYIQKH